MEKPDSQTNLSLQDGKDEQVQYETDEEEFEDKEGKMCGKQTSLLEDIPDPDENLCSSQDAGKPPTTLYIDHVTNMVGGRPINK